MFSFFYEKGNHLHWVESHHTASQQPLTRPTNRGGTLHSEKRTHAHPVRRFLVVCQSDVSDPEHTSERHNDAATSLTSTFMRPRVHPAEKLQIVACLHESLSYFDFILL